MKVIVGNKEYDINVDEITEQIDNIFHKKLTATTGVTVPHHYIEIFIHNIINENNQLEIKRNQKFQKAFKELP